MDKFLLKAPACTPVQAVVLTDSILNMLVTDMRPLSIVEDGGFKAMNSIFHPNYELPSKWLEEKYEDIKDKMKKSLQETDTVALTTGIWTSVATEAYMGVMCHYLKNWKMVSHCLTTMPLQERDAAANIAEWKSRQSSMTMVQMLQQQQRFCMKTWMGIGEMCRTHPQLGCAKLPEKPTGYPQVCGCCKKPC